MTQAALPREMFDFPAWVPAAARHYVIHTELGLSIRALAREAGCHASTVMRQIRRFETRRDDPLVDDALRHLAELQAVDGAPRPGERAKAEDDLTVLGKLNAPGAVLAIARGLDRAVIAYDGRDETETVDRAVAERLALNDWIAPLPAADMTARLVRYRITQGGRQRYREQLAEAENRAGGFAEAAVEFTYYSGKGGPRGTVRVPTAESPLAGLSRRRDKDGNPFLEPDLVRVGERLREDFELAQLDEASAGIAAILAAEGEAADLPAGCTAARQRLRAALDDLGPELADVALRCCCFMEGMERTERRKGWSARSGKIVLRIALQQLSRHYAESYGAYGPMIG
ncbi:DUF6456 domain-containing protein [Aestuariibius sp. 2305UL40-4]|uniref:DUF6456 domain-containing protein n=1 Tax=Aestuariibius violaceus TaxID=3234132 RepID=UPI00346BB770